MSDTLQVEIAAPLAFGAPVGEAGATAALRVLQTVSALNEKPPVVSEEAVGLELELAKLQQKTQLLIELLAVALARDGTRPPSTVVQLGSNSCAWSSPQALTPGASGTLTLWLHPAAPEPLQWPAEITSCQAEAAGFALHASLLPLSEAAQAALERHIFALHRRAVAEAKSQRS